MNDAVIAAPGRTYGALAGWLKNMIIGTFLSLTPVTAVLVLGWLMRDMRRAAIGSLGGDPAGTGWVFGPRGAPVIARTLGGLAQNIRFGLLTFLAFGLGTLPFAGLWISSWWAGWDNSFNKGYEQALVGPASALAGIAIFMVMMIYIPLAQAHMATENRFGAFFEFARVRSVFRHTGWRYVIWTAGILVVSLPVFVARGLPTFVEGILPGFADYTAQQVGDLQTLIALVMSAYLVASLMVFRRWQARIYAQAAARAASGRDRALWSGSVIADFAPTARGRAGWHVLRPLRFAMLAALWFGVAVLIYVGQFLNHSWHVWLTHPMIFLPWMP